MCESEWFYAGASVRGSSHEVNGSICQDIIHVEALGPERDILIIAISDGAGSASHADEGAKIVVEEWVAFSKNLIANNPQPATVISDIDRKDIENLMLAIQARVTESSTRHQVNPSEYSATMLGAIVHSRGGVVAQVGDGCWVLRSNDVLACASWPQGGEFVGQTVFATSKSASDFIQLATLPPEFDMLVGFTDGIERMAIDLAAMLPSSQFFLPLARGLRDLGTNAENALREFLASDRVCAVTDDDKSIVVILRRDASIR